MPDEPKQPDRPLPAFLMLRPGAVAQLDAAGERFVLVRTGGLPKPVAFRQLVREIAEIAAAEGIAATARKDLYAEGQPSRFVRLADAVLARLPAEVRRPRHSWTALATAISRALHDPENDPSLARLRERYSTPKETLMTERPEERPQEARQWLVLMKRLHERMRGDLEKCVSGFVLSAAAEGWTPAAINGELEVWGFSLAPAPAGAPESEVYTIPQAKGA
jgi:hypothetical protein